MSHSHTIYLAFHEGKFDKIMKVAGYPQICLKPSDCKIVYMLEPKLFCLSKVSDDALVSFFKKRYMYHKPTTPWGIISWEHPSNDFYIYSFQITLTACNKITVAIKMI